MSYSLRVMDIHPSPRHLGQLVVHVVGLVQEQLQHQPVVRPGQSDFPHGHLERETVSQQILRATLQSTVLRGSGES